MQALHLYSACGVVEVTIWWHETECVANSNWSENTQTIPTTATVAPESKDVAELKVISLASQLKSSERLPS